MQLKSTREKMSSSIDDQQTIEITATCRTPEEAAQIAEKHKKFAGVIRFEIIGNVIKFICQVSKKLALTTYGKLKDTLPWYCSCSCRPIA